MKRILVILVCIMTLVVGILIVLEKEPVITLTKAERDFVESSPMIRVGVYNRANINRFVKERQGVYQDALSNFLLSNFGLDTELVLYESESELIQDIINNKIDVVSSTHQIDALGNYNKTTMPLTEPYNIYSKDSSKNLSIVDLSNASIGYIDSEIMAQLNSYYYFDEHFSGVKYDSEELLYEALVNEEIDLIMVPFIGNQYVYSEEEIFYNTYDFADVPLVEHVYFSEVAKEGMTLFKKWVEQSNRNGSRANKTLTTYDYASQAFNDSLTEDENNYYQNLTHMNILVGEDEAPLYIDTDKGELGVLAEAKSYIEAVTKLKVNIYTPQDMVSSSINEEDIDFISGAHLHKEAFGNFIDTQDLAHGRLAIIGRGGITSVVDHRDLLAFKRVVTYSDDQMSQALKILYPRVEIVEATSYRNCVELILDGQADYAIMNDFLFRYYAEIGITRELSITGYYNINTPVEILARDDMTASIYNKAINLMDLSQMNKNAETSLLEYNDDNSKYVLLYGIIIFLILTLVVILVVNLRSITDRKRVEYLSTHDSLTKGLNLNGIEWTLRRMTLTAGYRLVVMDINQFKKVNDQMSFDYGNEILVKLHDTMTSYIGDYGLVARNGGDEFVIAIFKDKTLSNEAFIKRLHQYVTKQLLEMTNMDLTVTFGIADNLESNKNVESVYTMAEDALYKLKENTSEGIMYYTEELRELLETESQLSKEIHYAFDLDELVLHYQPQIDLESGRVVGAEALVRWQHNKRGLMYPGQFLNIVKNENLISALDYYVLESCMKQLRTWKENKQEVGKLSINITPFTLSDEGFYNKLSILLKKYDVDGDKICLEITEDFDVLDEQFVEDVLNKVKLLGVCIAMDDFGTGYSSLNYIVKYPIDVVKIDKSLINDIANKTSDFKLLTGLIGVLQGLNKQIVVEGIETIDQVRYLDEFNHLIAQGYYYSKPVDLATFETMK